MYCLFICLSCLFLIAVVRRQRLRESPGARRSRSWAAASGRARQVTLNHIEPVCSFSLPSIHIALHASILYLSLILRIWVHTWLVILSHADMSVIQVLPYSWCWVWLLLLLSVGLPSIVMWGDRGEDRCCGLSKVGMVETVGFWQVMWFVMHESAKDQVTGVDTPGQ
jgi:hypothetical protein